MTYFIFQKKNPQKDWMRIANSFNEKKDFPHCIGANDGKDVLIKCPTDNVSTYLPFSFSRRWLQIFVS